MSAVLAHKWRHIKASVREHHQSTQLFAIAAVVVGGTLLTGGSGSVVTTLAGVLLLGTLFNVLNFENGKGWISLSAAWQSVVRGLFLLVVVLLQARLTRDTSQKA